MNILVIYKEMSELTSPLCAKECRAPHACCSSEYCEMTIEYAKKNYGVDLTATGHSRLPLMGPNGCIAAPHYRPLCTVHLCEGTLDSQSKKFQKEYYRLRNLLNNDPTLR